MPWPRIWTGDFGVTEIYVREAGGVPSSYAVIALSVRPRPTTLAAERAVT
jgi:hypothetical protein